MDDDGIISEKEMEKLFYNVSQHGHRTSLNVQVQIKAQSGLQLDIGLT